MVAAQSVNAALRRIRKYVLIQTGLANFLRDVLFFWKRLARSSVFDEFDAKKKAESANIADVRVRLQRRNRVAEFFCGRSHAIKELMRFEMVENRVARSSRHRMRLIRETVLKYAGTFGKRIGNAPGNEDRAEWRVPACDSLAHQNHVRFNAPVLNRERLSSAAHAGHDFIGDEKDAVFAADFSDARGVSLGGCGGAESGADDRFENKGADGIGISSEENGVEIVGAGDFALRKSFFERAVVAETRSDVAPFREEWFVRRAAREIAADGHRPKRAAVIALSA